MLKMKLFYHKQQKYKLSLNVKINGKKVGTSLGLNTKLYEIKHFSHWIYLKELHRMFEVV